MNDNANDRNLDIPNGNNIDNVEPVRKLPSRVVEAEANRMIMYYSNSDKWRPFYCKCIYRIGLPRIKELEGKVSDAKFPGKLLTRLLKEELDQIESQCQRADMINRIKNSKASNGL